jgi:hypothetical protein
MEVGVPAGGAGMVDPVSVGVADVGRGKHELEFAGVESPQVERMLQVILAVEDVWVDRWAPAGCCVEAKGIVVRGVRTDELNVYGAGVDDELIVPIDGVCVRLAGAPGTQREDENDEAAAKQRNPLPRGETESSPLRLRHTSPPWSAGLAKSINPNRPRFLSATNGILARSILL